MPVVIGSLFLSADFLYHSITRYSCHYDPSTLAVNLTNLQNSVRISYGPCFVSFFDPVGFPCVCRNRVCILVGWQGRYLVPLSGVDLSTDN